ncbi:DUF4214 domain-containing protein [Orrella daihaiensis]|uniref:DUF4214 domain-containing protein n=1 Tax=Orrella daihaiensis TaxID=2782176 RepID=A0ABY4AM66_9BURK|nr:DUF4214 domain-containing protein [Orrella daihaiensis]UOD51411.1 DUF4214 domain-containing protein [Orrella daihaiensis]
MTTDVLTTTLDDMVPASLGSDRPYSAGLGNDIVSYNGNSADYLITQDHAKVIVLPLGDLSDPDIWVNVESLLFVDRAHSVNYDSAYGQIAALYDKLFNRQADLDGFQYWATQAKNGVSMGAIAVSMLNSDEYTRITGKDFDALETTEQVEILYEEILERDADQAGLDYWANELSSGNSADNVAATMMLPTFQASRSFMEPALWNFFM